jgi:hypothetical protein
MEALFALAQRQYVSPFGIASYYAVTGDNDRALDWLERAYAERDGTLVWLKVHPRLDGLRGESRFRSARADAARFLSRMLGCRYPPEQKRVSIYR